MVQKGSVFYHARGGIEVQARNSQAVISDGLNLIQAALFTRPSLLREPQMVQCVEGSAEEYLALWHASDI